MWARAFTALIVAYAVAAFITSSLNLNYESRWMSPRFVFFKCFQGERNFTESELADYSGKDSSKILLAINGTVYDVSAKPLTYGPLGAYHFFAGKDAARAFGTGCFKTHLTHDLRGLTNDELEHVRSWERFFEKNKRYWKVGEVIHEQLTGEPPEPCNNPIPQP